MLLQDLRQRLLIEPEHRVAAYTWHRDLRPELGAFTHPDFTQLVVVLKLRELGLRALQVATVYGNERGFGRRVGAVMSRCGFLHDVANHATSKS